MARNRCSLPTSRRRSRKISLIPYKKFEFKSRPNSRVVGPKILQLEEYFLKFGYDRTHFTLLFCAPQLLLLFGGLREGCLLRVSGAAMGLEQWRAGGRGLRIGASRCSYGEDA